MVLRHQFCYFINQQPTAREKTMPTYNYKCESCEDIFTRYLKIADMETPMEEPCPNCGENGNVRRSIENPMGFQADVLPPLNSDFKETMKKIRKANAGSNIPDY